MSESLTTLANKVDFSEDSKQCRRDSEDGGDSSAEEDEDGDNAVMRGSSDYQKPMDYKYSGGGGDGGGDSKKKREEAERSAHLDAELFEKSQWPWDSVRNKLKFAFLILHTIYTSVLII